MQKINLREIYPDIYKIDTCMEVSDEVMAVFLEDKRAEAAYERQMYRYKAHYSLDCGDSITYDALLLPLMPDQIVENRQMREELYSAVMKLPAKQAKRIYAHFYLEMSITEIAHAERVSKSRISESIRRGLQNLLNQIKK